MEKLIAIVVSFCIGLAATAQSTPKLLASGNFNQLSVDNFGHIYLVSNTNQIKKINSNGDSLAVFNDVRQYGTVGTLDVSNPLKPMVFYKDMLTIVLLDRLLGKKAVINLNKLGLYQIGAACISYDGFVWVYNELDATVAKLDDNGIVVQQTADLRQALGVNLRVNSMFDYRGHLYLYDSTQGLYEFDYYGALLRKQAIKNYSSVAFLDNVLYGVEAARIDDLDNWPITKTWVQNTTALTGKLYPYKNGFLVVGKGAVWRVPM
ncbi:MAG: hypothetical protein EAY72_09420 [Bacteroidetes bacterium]|nr:MAG: hypothetical protein EAY72_09420 [Bacteroidota bacterium]